jgi:hypothetical protein
MFKHKKKYNYFMENHIYSVWTFMCLLKTLLNKLEIENKNQNNLWHPSYNNALFRVLQEIIIEEQTDIIENNVYSHLELYIKSMKEIDAETSPIEWLLFQIENQINISEKSILKMNIPNNTKIFILNHLFIIENWSFDDLLTYFAYGRELLIPSIFEPILLNIESNSLDYPMLKLYLKKHIEIDKEHGNKIQQFVLKKNEIIDKAYEDRLLLWDGIYEKILKNNDKI